MPPEAGLGGQRAGEACPQLGISRPTVSACEITYQVQLDNGWAAFYTPAPELMDGPWV